MMKQTTNNTQNNQQDDKHLVDALVKRFFAPLGKEL
jgi:hypothetical protein